MRAYRGVGSVTEAAGEELGMFDSVCGQVHLQAGSICVTTVTVVALERLVFVVLPTVRLKGGNIQGGGGGGGVPLRKTKRDERKSNERTFHQLRIYLPVGWTTG